MKTSSTEVMMIRCRNEIEKSTRRTYRYFNGFESHIYVAISTSNRCPNFNVCLRFKIDEIWTNLPRGISMSTRQRNNGR